MFDLCLSRKSLTSTYAEGSKDIPITEMLEISTALESYLGLQMAFEIF